MSTKTSDSFLLNNTIENVTDEDCKKVAHLVDAAKAFARSTYQCVYIIDYYKILLSAKTPKSIKNLPEVL